MTDCPTIRAQLLVLPTCEFHTLAPHLDACTPCRTLADRILDQEAHVMEYTEDYSQVPGMQGSMRLAQQEAPVGNRGWILAGAVAMAAAATLLLSTGWWASVSSDETESSHGTEAEQYPNLVELGRGRSALFTLDRLPQTLSVVKSDVAACMRTIWSVQRSFGA